jgi:dTDP-4-dehydrorhamnose reductase
VKSSLKTKRVYITGLTGTLAPFLIRSFKSRGYLHVGQHIHIHNVEDITTSLDDVKQSCPNIIIHAALGPIAWTEALAMYAKHHNIEFVYISSVSVFDENASGPYTVNDIPKTTEGYGGYKYASEQAVMSIYSQASIIRLGWQIDPTGRTDTNNMFRFFNEQHKTKGRIAVSSRFYPSCSYLDDTAKGIIHIIEIKQPGVYHLNANKDYSLFELATLLKTKRNEPWIVEKDDTFSRNDLMIDNRMNLTLIK